MLKQTIEQNVHYPRDLRYNKAEGYQCAYTYLIGVFSSSVLALQRLLGGHLPIKASQLGQIYLYHNIGHIVPRKL